MAANYERYFVPAIGGPLADDLVEHAGLRTGERVLDAACGTGVVAQRAAEKVGPIGTVAGLDLNPGMLAVARQTAAPAAHIQWQHGNLEKMPLSSAAFDVVLCQLSLQFVPHRADALREMRRVLVDGGRVCLNVPGPAAPIFVVLADAMGCHAGPEAAGFVQHVFSLHEIDEVKHLLTDAGFHDPDVHAYEKEFRLPAPRDFLWQYVNSTPLARVAAPLDARARDELERDVVDRWQEFVTDGGMRYPQRIVEAIARN